MSITYKQNCQLDVALLQNLYQQAGWARDRLKKGIQQMLEHTPIHVSAWDGETLVGFARENHTTPHPLDRRGPQIHTQRPPQKPTNSSSTQKRSQQ